MYNIFIAKQRPIRHIVELCQILEFDRTHLNKCK